MNTIYKMNLNALKFFVFICFIFTGKVSALNYYLVGGQGNWSQFSTHWATTSGGSTFHTQVPQSTDNVFFDSFSFTAPGQTVTVDQTLIYCASIDWTGVTNNPVFAGLSGNEMRIYGSLAFVTGMSLTFQGTV